MSITLASAPSLIAGHPFELCAGAGDVLRLRIALEGASLASLTRALGKLDGVRVSGGPEPADRERPFLVHCLGFKMVLACSVEEPADFAVGLVSRTPQVALAVVSDLGSLLERLMTEQARPGEAAPSTEGKSPRRQDKASPGAMDASSGLRWGRRESALQRAGKPLARKTELTRKTPLARGRFPRR